MQDKISQISKKILMELKNHLGMDTYIELANHLGVKQNTLSTWKKRGSVDADLIYRKCDNLNYDWLTTGEGPMFRENQGTMADAANYKPPARVGLSAVSSPKQKSPELGLASIQRPKPDYTVVPMAAINGSAGPGTIVDGEEVEDLLAFRTTWLQANVSYDVTALSCIRVEGDSMEPTISNGDVVLINHNATSIDGICAINLDGLLMVKRLQRMPSGSISVISDNHTYDLVEVTEDNGVSLIVIGQVVWLGRSF